MVPRRAIRARRGFSEEKRLALNPYERETTINASDGDDVVRIWTAQRKFINRLQRDERFTLTDSGVYDDSVWAQFSIPADQWNPISGAKRRSGMTDEQKAEAAERLRRARKTNWPGFPENPTA